MRLPADAPAAGLCRIWAMELHDFTPISVARSGDSDVFLELSRMVVVSCVYLDGELLVGFRPADSESTRDLLGVAFVAVPPVVAQLMVRRLQSLIGSRSEVGVVAAYGKWSLLVDTFAQAEYRLPPVAGHGAPPSGLGA